ncbi:MAG: hypothetical protein ACOZQL_26125 [Myxococcota bacterium]
MTRQVAIGAVIAFAATVLLFSVWTPSPAPLPAPPPPPAPAPAVLVPNKEVRLRPMEIKPLPPGLIDRSLIVQGARDAGTP